MILIRIVVLLFLIVISAIFFDGHCQRARVEIDSIKVTLQPLDDKTEIEQLKDGKDVPSGYIPIARGEFKTGVATLKCGERLMIQKTEDKARAIGATAFRFYEVKEPNIILNSCYKAKILFLKKE